jgi:hypothetical protein
MLTFNEILHIYRWEAKIVPSFSEIVRECGLVDMSGIDPLVLERARLLGTAVHKATEYLDRGILNWHSVDNGILFYVLAWEEFCKDLNFKPLQIEQMTYCGAHRYACTPDRLGAYMRELRVIVDIKTTSTIKRLAQLQTMAQKLALAENGFPCEHRIVVQLRKDGTYKIRQHKDDTDDLKVWLSCVHYFYNRDEASLAIINEWKNRFKKGGENVY